MQQLPIPLSQREEKYCDCGWHQFKQVPIVEIHRDKLQRKDCRAAVVTVELECARCGRSAVLDPGQVWEKPTFTPTPATPAEAKPGT